MHLKILSLFILAFFSQFHLTQAEDFKKEWIVYFSTLHAAQNYQMNHPEQVLDQVDQILKVRLTKDEKDLLLKDNRVKSIEPNYVKTAATETDPLFPKQWGLQAIHYEPQLSTSFSKNELLGKSIIANDQEFIYDQSPFSANTFSIKPSTKLSRVSIELDHVEGPWSLSIYHEGNQIATNEGSLEKLDVLLPEDFYNELTFVVRNTDTWSTPPTIEKVIGVNHLIIAVIDSGVDLHEDFGDNILYSLGKDFKEDLKWPEDTNGHGTHVTGILAAATNNGLGITGVIGNYPIDILPLKVLDQNGYGGDFEISKAVHEAIDRDVDLINMSLAGKGETLILKEAIQKALQQGIPIVAAAGNWNISTEKVYPASYPGVIAVSAITAALEKVPTSNFGWEVDISAPGYDIVSTYLDNEYKALTGTSMATPFVSGTLAIIKSLYPELDLIELRNHLFLTADDIFTEGYDQYSGYGLLNMKKALEAPLSTKGLEWLSLKDGQDLNVMEHALGISSKWMGENVEVFVNDERVEKEPITDSLKSVDFSQIGLSKSAVSLFTFITDHNKNIYEMDQIIVRNPDKESIAYRDVPASFWAYNEIMNASQNGIIQGYEDGSFQPNAHISRKHSVLMLQRFFGWDDLGSYISPFQDVESTLTVSNFSIMSAYRQGVIQGYNEQFFKPNNPLTRGQMALILARSLDLDGVPFTGNSYSFDDVKPTDEFYDEVQHLASMGIISNQDRFRPNDYISRAEFAAMIFRIE